MSRFDQILTWIENGVAGLAFSSAAILAIIQVIMRTFFNHIIFWAEEAVIYLIILATFVGAVITLRHNEHVGVDLLPVFFKKWKRAFGVLSALLVALYCGAIGTFGWLMLTEPASLNVVTPALKLPLWVVQISLPIGLTLMFLRALEIVYRTLRYGQGFPEAEREQNREEAIG